MSLTLICANGHRWDAPDDHQTAAAATTCPTCGAAGQFVSVDRLPPPPPPRVAEPPTEFNNPAKPAPDERGPGMRLGAYVLLDKLGEGGMGAVYKARHDKLERVVALKLIRAERLTHADAVKRFQREIRAAAQLDHPHIVRALDADEVDGTHLLVMEYVEGGVDLARLVAKHGPLHVAQACAYIQQAALGLQHAHERGLVHRDIKPHNLLLAGDDATATTHGQVKILDMGLARLGDPATSGQSISTTLTKEGVVMGTLDYMAPEQARDSHAVDIRADLYSLGCTLFYLLTGKVPFPGGTTADKLLKHQLDPPPDLRTLRPDAPAAVVAIVNRLLAKRPGDRFQTPAELVDALDRLNEATAVSDPAARRAQPTRKRTPAVASSGSATQELARQWAEVVRQTKTPAAAPAAARRGQRRPRIQITAAAGLALTLLILLLAWRPWQGEPDDAAKEPEKLPKLSPEELAERAENTRRADADQALESLTKRVAAVGAGPLNDDTLPRDLRAFLTKYAALPAATKTCDLLGQVLPKIPSPLDVLDAKNLPQDCLDEWRAVGRKPPPELVGVLGDHRQRHWEPQGGVAYSPDGTLIAVNVTTQYTVYLYDAQTLQLLRALRGHSGNVATGAFSPDSRRLATVGWSKSDNTLRVWDVASGQELPKRVTLPAPGLGVVWLPDGKGIVACAGTHVVRVDANTLAQEWDIDVGAPLLCVAVSADGRQLAAGGRDGAVRVWDLAGPKPVERAAFKAARIDQSPDKYPDHQRYVHGIVFLDEAKHVAAAYPTWVSAWPLANGSAPEGKIGFKGPRPTLTSDKIRTLAAPAPAGVRLYDCTALKPTPTRLFAKEAGPIVALTFAPNGKRLATYGQDGTLRLWDVDSGNALRPLTGPVGPLRTVCFSADDHAVLTAGNAKAHAFDAASGKWQTAFSASRAWYVPGRPHPTRGAQVLAIDADGMARLHGPWGDVLYELGHARCAVPGQDGRRALLSPSGGALVIVDLATGKEVRRFDTGHGHQDSLAWSPDGKRALTVGIARQEVRLWDVDAGRETHAFPVPGVHQVAFTPDGRVALLYQHNGWATLYDVDTGKPVRSLQGPVANKLHAGGFAPDGKRLALSYDDGHCIVWEVATGAKLHEWQLPGNVSDMTFAADGRHLATANANGTVYLFRVPP